MTRKEGFPPVARPDARVLILGSLPGQRSLDDRQYYAHPRNAFWRIVESLVGIDATLPYGQRVERLAAARIALWDVLHASNRPGSLDSAIDVDSAEANDFGEFFRTHPRLRLVAFNGRKAEELYRRLVEPGLALAPPCVSLPSTSPAHAALDLDAKLRSWRVIVEALANDGWQAPGCSLSYR